MVSLPALPSASTRSNRGESRGRSNHYINVVLRQAQDDTITNTGRHYYMNRTRIFVLTIIAALFLTGSSCSKDDTSLVVDFINSWMQSRGILDENGKPTGSTIRYVASGGWVSSGNKDNDAIIDAGQVIKSVKDADGMAQKADEALGKTPPDRATALTNLTDAVDKRPNDWHLRSQKGVLLLEMGRASEASEYLNTNNDSCNPGKNPGMSQVQKERCFKQIQSEANLMANSNVRSNRTGELPRCDLFRNQGAANELLANLASSLDYSADSVDEYRQTADSISSNKRCK